MTEDEWLNLYQSQSNEYSLCRQRLMALAEECLHNDTRINSYRTLLIDAMGMLLEIERNRQMPPFAQTQQQYAALGHRIREALQRFNDISNT